MALKVKLYQVDPAKLVKDDKTVKMAKTWLQKRSQKRKHEMSVQQIALTELADSVVGAQELQGIGMNVTIGEDGLPIDKNDEEEAENEQQEQQEQMEGQENQEGSPGEHKGDQEEAGEGEKGSDQEDDGAEADKSSTQHDVHASTTNVSAHGSQMDD